MILQKEGKAPTKARKQILSQYDKPRNLTKSENQCGSTKSLNETSLKEGRPLSVIQVRNDTTTVDANGIHSVVSIDCITLAKKDEKALHAMELKHNDDVRVVAGNTGDE